MSAWRNLHVMVVDDDEIALEVARERLEEAGYRVTARKDSIGTSAAILQVKPQILLLDVNMPGLSGDALAKILSKNGHQLIVLLHSARSEADLARLVQASGAHGAIQKTSDAALFLAKLDAAVARLGLSAARL